MNNIKPLVIIMIVALLGFVSIGTVGYLSLKDSLIEAKKQDVVTVLNIARNQSSEYIKQYQQGLLTKQQTDQKIIEFLSAMQFESAYIWANDDSGIARVHAREEIIGQFQQSYVEHIAQLTHQDVFFLTQPNIKPVTDQRVSKINGITKIPEWDWVIGYGIYMDDINKIAINTEVQFVMLVIVSMLLVGAVSFYWIRRVND